jgi:hypothetical protein
MDAGPIIRPTRKSGIRKCRGPAKTVSSLSKRHCTEPDDNGREEAKLFKTRNPKSSLLGFVIFNMGADFLITKSKLERYCHRLKIIKSWIRMLTAKIQQLLRLGLCLSESKVSGPNQSNKPSRIEAGPSKTSSLG